MSLRLELLFVYVAVVFDNVYIIFYVRINYELFLEEQTKKEKEKLEREERLKKIREKMENNQRTIIYCPCGSQFQRKEKNRHEKCQNHIQYLQLQQNK